MNRDIWLLAGLRTPFARSDSSLASYDAIELSVPVVQAMIAQLGGGKPDFAVWGTVLPNLTWSNIAREVLLDAKVDPTIPAFSTVMACSTSMIGAIEAAGMLDGEHRSLALVGGVESLSHVQIGLCAVALGLATQFLAGQAVQQGSSNVLARSRPHQDRPVHPQYR